MSLTNLVKIDYWFSQPFSAHGAVFWIFIIIFLVMIVGGIVLFLISKKIQDRINNKILRKFSSFCFSMGFWGIVWFFFRQEKVLLLAWRVWMLLWLIVFIWWLARILDYVVRRVPQIKQEHREQGTKQKYIT